jgi:hypothetical protein
VIAVAPAGSQGQWLGREGFVAEAAVQLDRLSAQVARLERELEKSRTTVAEMAEEANRYRRFQAFEDTLKNSREYKITDLQRCCKDMKARLDAIEGDKMTFLGLRYKSFEPIDRKLTELSAVETQIERANNAARRNEVLFYAAMAVAVVAIVIRLVL